MSTELFQTLTETHTHRMQKAFPQVDYWVTSSQSNWYNTIKTAKYYLLRIYKRVSNTAQLPTKPNQVALAEAGRLEGKPKSSLNFAKTKEKTK